MPTAERISGVGSAAPSEEGLARTKTMKRGIFEGSWGRLDLIERVSCRFDAFRKVFDRGRSGVVLACASELNAQLTKTKVDFYSFADVERR